VQDRYSKETKNCTQEKRRGLKSEIFTLCNIREGNSVYLWVWYIIPYSMYCICFAGNFSVYLCYLCCSIFLNRTKCYYIVLLHVMIIISNCDPSQSGKLYGEKGFLNPGHLENLEGEFKIVLMFSGGFKGNGELLCILQ